jgi:adenylosuccinate lyase
MVPRYSRPEMTAIWSAENRYRIWWQIEVFAAEAMGRIGMIPAEDAATIRAAYDRNALGEIDIDAIDAIEAVTKHDVIAFLTWAGEKLGPERRWLHQGMTSSDVLDTTLAAQLKQAADLLIGDADHRPKPRNPRRADHLRAQARASLCGVLAQSGAAGGGAQRGRHLRHLRRDRHLRQRSARD